MFCPKCGTQHNSKFCPNCGAPAFAGPIKQAAQTPPPQPPAQKAAKKPIYQRVWFWIVVGIVLFFGIIGSLSDKDELDVDGLASPTGAATAAATTTAITTPTPKPSQTTEPTPLPAPTAIKMPGIAGSQAYDVILSLEEYGIPKPDTQTTADGFSWSSDITDIEGIQFQYDISANEDHEIAAASFIVLGKDNIGILAFCASLPYTAADSDAATAFVNEHLDGEATITIGDAIFTIYQTKVGPRLDITVVGYDDYVWSKAGG